MCVQRVEVVRVATVAEFLTHRGLSIGEDDVVAVLDAQLGAHLAHRGAAALTAGTADFLDAHGGIPGPVGGAADREAAHTTGILISVVATSLRVDEVAVALRIDPSRVRHRIRDGSLAAIRVGRANRLPAWQFTDDLVPLPGLRAVLAAFPRHLHPLEVLGFMTTPQPELAIDGNPAPPRAWLASGGDPDLVVDLARDLAIAP